MTFRGLAAQNFNMLKPGNIISNLKNFRIYEKGRKMYREGKFAGLTMRDAFKLLPPLRGKFRLMHLLVMSLVSSMYYEEVMDAPADFFFGKMDIHTDFFVNPVFGMFQASGNTISYVNALASHFEDNVVLNSRIKSVARKEKKAVLKMEDGSVVDFDKIVFACNADQALALLENPTDEERKLLGPWTYKDGPIVVHKDRSSFSEKEYYNLFTFLYTERDGKVHTSVNGHIRNLKSVPDDCRYISSQHPNFPIDDKLVEYSKVFRTPVFTTDSVATIKKLPTLNGKMNSYYCGSHFGYGLHEDCVISAIAVEKMLGVEWD